MKKLICTACKQEVVWGRTELRTKNGGKATCPKSPDGHKLVK